MHSLVGELRRTYPDASHHCWAYLVGAPQSSACVGMSDDGEPKGTAGRPMLNVLLHAPLGNVAVVVTRYFGGTKLGTGGLMRAYSDCVKTALAQVQTTPYVQYARLQIQLDYAHVDAVLRHINLLGAQVIDSQYAVRVDLIIDVPNDQQANFKQFLNHLAH